MLRNRRVPGKVPVSLYHFLVVLHLFTESEIIKPFFGEVDIQNI